MSKYMKQAYKNAQQSCDPKHKTGAVIVNKGGVVTFGINTCDVEIDWFNKEEKSMVLHAEQIAIMQYLALHHRFDDPVMYVTMEPCLNCLKYANYAGIKKIFYDQPIRPRYDEPMRMEFVKRAGIELRREVDED